MPRRKEYGFRGWEMSRKQLISPVNSPRNDDLYYEAVEFLNSLLANSPLIEDDEPKHRAKIPNKNVKHTVTRKVTYRLIDKPGDL